MVLESKWLFKCKECETVMAIITTKLDPEKVDQSPECPCGETMINMASDEYAYGN